MRQKEISDNILYIFKDCIISNNIEDEEVIIEKKVVDGSFLFIIYDDGSISYSFIGKLGEGYLYKYYKKEEVDEKLILLLHNGGNCV